MNNNVMISKYENSWKDIVTFYVFAPILFFVNN